MSPLKCHLEGRAAIMTGLVTFSCLFFLFPGVLRHRTLNSTRLDQCRQNSDWSARVIKTLCQDVALITAFEKFGSDGSCYQVGRFV